MVRSLFGLVSVWILKRNLRHSILARWPESLTVVLVRCCVTIMWCLMIDDWCLPQKYIEHAMSIEDLSPYVPLYKVSEGNEPCFFKTYFSWDNTKSVVCLVGLLLLHLLFVFYLSIVCSHIMFYFH
jgi:hypothetical protein